MSREIKFRAWDKQERVMRDWDWVKTREGLPHILGPVEKLFIAMQYTGLKDKNGTEIYEGDVIEFISEMWAPQGPLKLYRKVLNQSTLLDVLREADAIKDGRVIGNIHESPELLTLE